MANEFVKKVTLEQHQSRLYDLVDAITEVNADAVGTAIAGLIDDIFVYKDEEVDMGQFIDEVIEELSNHAF